MDAEFDRRETDYQRAGSGAQRGRTFAKEFFLSAVGGADDIGAVRHRVVYEEPGYRLVDFGTADGIGLFDSLADDNPASGDRMELVDHPVQSLRRDSMEMA